MRIYLVLILLFFFACDEAPERVDNIPSAFPTPEAQQSDPSPPLQLSREVFHDRVLGLLVGSAIGDAMGAPVEMWTRDQITERYGFIDRLIRNVRPASAEGVWKSNMEGGTSTDDTRWKWLMGQYLLTVEPGEEELDRSFAQYLVRQYDLLRDEIVENNGLQPDRIESNMLYLQWLQEWVKVAKAWLSNDVRAYSAASAKFYGGEMACAGLLYAPMIGLLYPGQPERAFEAGWALSFFDLGYARDITAMAAALTSEGFRGPAPADSLLQLHYRIDKQNYADSRLIGRIVNGIYEGALSDFRAGLAATEWAGDEKLPAYFRGDTAKYLLMHTMFERMDQKLQDIPFHAKEIYMITLSSLLFAQGDFLDAMVFVTNYGRDNDTVGAVSGAILGAQLGFSGLPSPLREQVLQANLRRLRIDLRALADQLTDHLYQDHRT